MTSYRCYFLDKDDRVGDEVTIHAGNLADAIDQADVRLKERPHFCAIELWVWEGETPRLLFVAQPDALAR
jgi:hypothetical protein